MVLESWEILASGTLGFRVERRPRRVIYAAFKRLIKPVFAAVNGDADR